MFKKEKKEEPNNLIIGYYSKSVFITYLSVISATIGMFLAFNHKITYALICLVISGICDAFDGKVARKCKRSNNEKSFGIQIDSLADMVAFVFLPITIFYGLGYTNWYNVVIFALFTLGGVIRLGYFNVVAEETGKNGPIKYYSGLPVTSSAIIFPLIYIAKHFISSQEFAIIYSLTMLFIAILYVLNFKLKKPTPGVIYFFVFGGVILSIVLYLLAKWNIIIEIPKK